MNNSNDHYLNFFASPNSQFSETSCFFPNFHQNEETEIEIEVQMRYFCHISAEQMKTLVRRTQNGSSSCLVRDNSRDRGRRGWWQNLTGPQYLVDQYTYTIHTSPILESKYWSPRDAEFIWSPIHSSTGPLFIHSRSGAARLVTNGSEYFNRQRLPPSDHLSRGLTAGLRCGLKTKAVHVHLNITKQ